MPETSSQSQVAIGLGIPMTAATSGHALSQMKSIEDSSFTLTRGTKSKPKKHKISSTLQLNTDIRLFSLPLLETASIRVNPFNRKPGPPSLRIFSRFYPQNSLMENVDAKHWRQFWIKEGSIPSGSFGVVPKIQMIRIFDHEGRSFRLQIITESKPGRFYF